jgi:hypothetical protein
MLEVEQGEKRAFTTDYSQYGHHIPFHEGQDKDG